MLYKLDECQFGRLYVPERESRGGVLVLHGSEGGGYGGHDNDALILACHGYTALACDWCSSPWAPLSGVPTEIIDVAIERPVEAMEWLQSHETVKSKKIAIHGFSRGAELALLIATLVRNNPVTAPAAISVLAASDKIEGGFSWNWKSTDGSTAWTPDATAWRWQGKALVTHSPIAIEECNQPVLLVHGVNDELWEVDRSKELERRLHARDRDVQALYLDGETHVLSAKGKYQATSALLSFIERVLKP